MKKYDLQYLIASPEYLKNAYALRQTVRGLRRRGCIAAIKTAIETAGLEQVTGVEVGVKFGTFSQQFLESIPQISQMVLVDQWKEFPQDHTDREKFGYAGRNQASWDRMAEMCETRMLNFGTRAEIIRMSSLAAADEVYMQISLGMREQPFFVYVDAGHSFQDVLLDCREWWEIVADGGMLCGDDYEEPRHPNRTESVSLAVEQFAKEIGGKVISHHRNWFIQKPLAA